ncbi:hypothetical protein [Methyloterricola oryzae]|uniref:hypothetical protein n=1 Tax=Methyloterricola oryzae TaxID=1495050 RepID=UPI00191010C5|nr:hypothetical protein [Methyloterricola oryzae]
MKPSARSKWLVYLFAMLLLLSGCTVYPRYGGYGYGGGWGQAHGRPYYGYGNGYGYPRGGWGSYGYRGGWGGYGHHHHHHDDD